MSSRWGGSMAAEHKENLEGLSRLRLQPGSRKLSAAEVEGRLQSLYQYLSFEQLQRQVLCSGQLVQPAHSAGADSAVAADDQDGAQRAGRARREQQQRRGEAHSWVLLLAGLAARQVLFWGRCRLLCCHLFVFSLFSRISRL